MPIEKIVSAIEKKIINSKSEGERVAYSDYLKMVLNIPRVKGYYLVKKLFSNS